MSFDEYWRTYLPDLITLLPESRQAHIVGILGAFFLDGNLPGREVTQRLVERDLRLISDDQYASWSLRDATSDGSERILDLLAEGAFVGGNRPDMMDYLSHMEYSEAFALRIRRAGERGLLTHDEVTTVLRTSLRNPPLPALVERPGDVRDLPFDLLHENGLSCVCVSAARSDQSSQETHWR